MTRITVCEQYEYHDGDWHIKWLSSSALFRVTNIKRGICMALAQNGKLRIDGLDKVVNQFTDNDKDYLLCIMLGILIGHTCRKCNSDMLIGKLHIKDGKATLEYPDADDIELTIDVDTNVYLLDALKNKVGIDGYADIANALSYMYGNKSYNSDRFKGRTVVFKFNSNLHTGNIAESWLGDMIHYSAHKIVMEDNTEIIMSAKNLYEAMKRVDEHDMNKMKLVSIVFIKTIKPEEVLSR